MSGRPVGGEVCAMVSSDPGGSGCVRDHGKCQISSVLQELRSADRFSRKVNRGRLFLTVATSQVKQTSVRRTSAVGWSRHKGTNTLLARDLKRRMTKQHGEGRWEPWSELRWPRDEGGGCVQRMQPFGVCVCSNFVSKS